jgi:LPS-assembly lipoprotein
MWLSRLAPLLLVAACGYSPALAPGGSAAQLMGQVELAEPKDRNDFDLARQLENRLGPAEAGAYRLETTIKTSEVAVGVTAEQETTRYNVRGQVTFQLIDAATGAQVLSGTVQNFTGYSTTDTVVATRTSQIDAHQRLMVILANDIVTRLITSGIFAE